MSGPATRSDAPPAAGAGAAARPLPRRVFLRGVLLGALGPALALGAAGAVAFAAFRPPLVWLTGVTRWEAQPFVAGAGLMLSLWLIATPVAAALFAAFRRLGPPALCARPVAAAACAALGAAGALTLLTAWWMTGGPGRPEFADELFNWSVLWTGAAAGAALCLDLGVRLSARAARPREAETG